MRISCYGSQQQYMNSCKTWGDKTLSRNPLKTGWGVHCSTLINSISDSPLYSMSTLNIYVGDWSTFIHTLFQQIVSKHLPRAWYWIRGIQQCARQMKLLSSCNIYLNEGLCWTNKLKNRWIYQKKNKQYPGHSEWFYSPESVVIHKNHHIICYVCVCVWKLLSLCDPMDWSPLGSSLHGILQARTLEWGSIPFSRGSSQPKNRTQASHIAGRFFTIWATREAL